MKLFNLLFVLAFLAFTNVGYSYANVTHDKEKAEVLVVSENDNYQGCEVLGLENYLETEKLPLSYHIEPGAVLYDVGWEYGDFSIKYSYTANSYLSDGKPISDNSFSSISLESYSCYLGPVVYPDIRKKWVRKTISI